MSVMAFLAAEQATQARAERDQAKVAARASENVRPSIRGTTSNDMVLLRQMLDEKDAAYIRLQHEYEKLKSQTATLTAAGALSSPTQVPQIAAPAPGANPRGRAWMEQLRQQDPERYKQIVEARQQWQQATDQRLQDQFDTLSVRAQNAATPDEAQVVNQIADTLGQLNQLRQSRDALANLPDDQRQIQMQQINEQMRPLVDQLNTLRDQDRTLQLQSLATQLGITSQNTSDFVDQVKKVYTSTQYQVPRGPGGPGGGLGGGGAGAGGATTPVAQPQR
jgi:hypothetical protein